MDNKYESETFRKMNVMQIKNFLTERGVSVNGYDKCSLINIASAVERMGIPCVPSATGNDNKLIIHEMEIGNPLKMDTVNNFIDSPPFGLYDIFNYLICHSTTYDKQGLAAYKSFEDYSLFEDGYVESLQTKTLTNECLHVYVGKVRPAMKVKTDDGKPCYNLWFILEGKGANRGSVIAAKCQCKGGRDGGCKHIGAAMYSLEDLLHTRGKDSVTSGSCLWTKKPISSTKACEVSDLIIEKFKHSSSKKKKKAHVYCQNIDVDVRAVQDRKPISKQRLSKLTQAMHEMQNKPAILPLFHKLYPAKPMHTSKKINSKKPQSEVPGIMRRKLQGCMEGNVKSMPEDIYKALSFSTSEIDEVNQTTVKQGHCREWYHQRAGFISASKCKQVFTRQTTIEKNKQNNTDVTCLVKLITEPKVPPTIGQTPQDPQHPLTWGLANEKNARDAYQRIERHNHHNLRLLQKGFLISKKKKFLGASPDNIRTCQCSDGCPNIVVEYKCPWKHRELHPKQAFLTKEIGGSETNGTFCLTSDSKYYYQIQTIMFVAELSLCDFVVWTIQGIFCLRVCYDAKFMENVCNKLELFWMSHVLPCMMNEASTNVHSTLHGM